MVYPELSKSILDAVFAVQRALGPGLLEAPYHNALYYEFRACGVPVEYNAGFTVTYRGQTVGEYFADLVVNRQIIIEVKAAAALTSVHEAQLLNYLHISGLRLGFLVNFGGIKASWKRMVL